MNLYKKIKAIAAIVVASLYVLMVNVNMTQRARVITEHRSLAQNLGGGLCSITPISEFTSAPIDATHSLLVSYPGSGKRFTWQVIQALTNYAIADDWNYSGRLTLAPLTIKTSWPHKAGVWSWGSTMDQVILLVRNPRWAIPSYHTMQFELGYATDWASSYARVAFVYTEHPAVEIWEAWRDANFEEEMQTYVDLVDFWMSGGVKKSDGETHDRCLNSGIDCHPKTVLDFDTFYNEHPTSEFFKLGTVLDAVENVEVIAARARVCVLDAVFDAKQLHNSNRDGHGPSPPSFRFEAAQLQVMEDLLIGLKDKYSAAPWDTDPVAVQLVLILSNYIAQTAAEKQFEVMMDLYDM